MDYYICAIIIVLLVFLIWRQNTTTACSNLDGSCYKVISSFDQSTHKQAADRLAKINNFNARLITYLRNRYLWGDSDDEEMKSITENLIKNYNPNAVKENNPIDKTNTSYVLEKGREIAFCLREKKTGENLLEDDSTLEFVNLHEISHLAMKFHDPNHSLEFWKTFRLVQKAAVDAGLYKPINYRENPLEYCGVDVNYNPIFDENLV